MCVRPDLSLPGSCGDIVCLCVCVVGWRIYGSVYLKNNKPTCWVACTRSAYPRLCPSSSLKTCLWLQIHDHRHKLSRLPSKWRGPHGGRDALHSQENTHTQTADSVGAAVRFKNDGLLMQNVAALKACRSRRQLWGEGLIISSHSGT